MRVRIASVFLLAVLGYAGVSAAADQVTAVPDEVRKQFNLAPFYEKCVLVEGMPIVSSAKVSDYALLEAAWIIRQMLGHRPEVIRAIGKENVRLAIMAPDEFTTQIPEHSDLRPPQYWDRRARGLGATKVRPAVSCGEENLLCYPGDPYSTENILVHEFGHVIHEHGMRVVDPTFDRRLDAAWRDAMAKGLYKDKYPSVNRMEYWAEGVQTWFDTNRENDHDHNHVNTRTELKEYDPALAALCAEVFGDTEWRYVKPSQRTPAPAHLAGYDPSKAPRFKWSEELLDWHRKFRAGDVTMAPPDSKRIELLAPDAREDWRSPSSSKRVDLYLQNTRKETVVLEWIDFEGRAKNYGRLRPGAHREHSSFEGHVFRISDDAGKPLGYFVVADSTSSAVIK